MPDGHIVAVSAADRSALYSAYIPFVRGGALYIPLDLEIGIGDGVLIALQLPDSNERQLFLGLVVLIVPAAGRVGKFCRGIGVQLTDSDLQSRISKILSGLSPAELEYVMPRWLS